jgi:hypothetical protein
MLNENAIAKTLAVVVGGWYALCAAIFWLFPTTAVSAGKILFHGVQIELMTFNVTNAVIGLVVWVVLAWVTGMVFAKLYNQWAS